MESNQAHLQDIKEIRNMMERSTRFLSLSGLSGVFAGIYALAGVAVAYLYCNIELDANGFYENAWLAAARNEYNFYIFFFTVGALILGLSLLTGTILTYRKSKKQNVRMWDHTSKRLLINLLIPLTTGGIFCLALLYHGKISMIAPATLIFYGLALINASSYTFRDIRYLGICEIVLGLIAAFYLGYGLIFWAIGFGVMHIVYGTSMYFKYEKE